MPSVSAFAATSENEAGPNALAENPTLEPRWFNADEPICLFPRFDTLGGPPRPGACRCIEAVVATATIAKAGATIVCFMILCPFLNRAVRR